MNEQSLPVPTIPLIDGAFDDLSVVYAENLVEPTDRDIKIVEEMASIGCTPREISGVMGFPIGLLKSNHQLSYAVLRGNERAKMSLRRLQWKTAQKNPIMQIFLGKQLLGQSDKVEHTKDAGDLERARKSFEDKLKNIIDISPKNDATEKPKRKRGRGSKEIVVDVGEGSTTSSFG